MRASAVIALGGAVLSLLSAGCAVRIAGRDGRIHTVGLVWSSQPVATTAGVMEPERTRFVFGPVAERTDPRWLELKAAGLVLEKTSHHAGLTLGYKDSIWVFPIPDGVTDVDSEAAKSAPPVVTVRSLP